MPADLATNLSLVASIDSKQRMSVSIWLSSQEEEWDIHLFWVCCL